MATKKTKKTATRKAKTTTAAKPKKKRSQIDATIQVLSRARKPMTCKAMVEAMTKRKLWTSPGGKTPHATLYASILREINTKGKDARFKKVDRGQFALTGKK